MNHWDSFPKFCYYERLAGGPDPHMAVVGWLAKDLPVEERYWRAGCYLSVYNVPGAELIWRHWSQERLLAEGEVAFARWVSENWSALPFRRERRAVRTPAKLARHLLSYATWSKDMWLGGWLAGSPEGPEAAYEYAWRDILRVWGMGRYVALKWCEFAERYCEAPIALPDLRARGGWSPRRALALLYPEREAELNGDDRPGHILLANNLAEKTRAWLSDGFDIELSRYELQVLLCDYKQCAVGRRQYPGRSQDSELVYGMRVETAAGEPSDLWTARKAIFPEWALGEIQGWHEVREPLGDVLADHGYIWSDQLYDWHSSKDDLAKPVPHLFAVA